MQFVTLFSDFVLFFDQLLLFSITQFQMSCQLLLLLIQIKSKLLNFLLFTFNLMVVLLLYFLERHFRLFLCIHLLDLLHQVSNLILKLCIYLSILLQLVLQLPNFIFIADFFL